MLDSDPAWKAKFAKAALEGAKYGGKTYLIPREISPTHTMFYNTDYFKHGQTSSKNHTRRYSKEFTHSQKKDHVANAIYKLMKTKTKEIEKISESTLETEKPAVGEPNDLLAMPKEIRDRLSDRRIVRPRTPRQAQKTEKIKIERDTILADRSALLVKRNDGQLLFVLNAFGRDVRPVSLRLLPCEALELAEFTQSAIPEPVRFKIAGIVTKYKGEKYLLLQRAARVYSHGNFAR